jgi:ureidoglycolate lyase
MGSATAEYDGFLKEISQSSGAKRNEQTSPRDAHNTMKIVRYEDRGGAKLGAVKGEGVVELTRPVPSLADDTLELIRQWTHLKPILEPLVLESPPDIALADVHLLAPVARPGKVMAIGLNYADHIKETGQKTPPHQIWFTKAVTSINGPFDPIELPIASTQVDYEAELVVIIGQRCKHVTKERAANVVFGYCAGNDVSVRDWQLQTPQWVLGKSFDTHAPIGPWIVTAGRTWQSAHDGHSLFRQRRAAAELQHGEPGVQRLRPDRSSEPRDDA